jgi:hypothetical protein
VSTEEYFLGVEAGRSWPLSSNSSVVKTTIHPYSHVSSGCTAQLSTETPLYLPCGNRRQAAHSCFILVKRLNAKPEQGPEALRKYPGHRDIYIQRHITNGGPSHSFSYQTGRETDLPCVERRRSLEVSEAHADRFLCWKFCYEWCSSFAQSTALCYSIERLVFNWAPLLILTLACTSLLHIIFLLIKPWHSLAGNG